MLKSLFRLSAIFVLMALMSIFATAQQSPSSFSVSSETANPTNVNNVPGYGKYGGPNPLYPESTLYELQYGQGNNLIVDDFVLGGKTFNPTASGITPLENVIINRVNNPQVAFEKLTAFYETTELVDDFSSNTTLELVPDFVNSLEELINSNIINRGSDNLFANSEDVNSTTSNNLERIDFILTQDGVSTTTPNDVGFLLIERGGNDSFKFAPITALNPDGTVASLGALQTASQATSWGLQDSLFEH